MSDAEKEKIERANAAKSEEKVRVYTELGLSNDPTKKVDDPNFKSIKSYFTDLLKQKHISARVKIIQKETNIVNDDPHFSQFLHEVAAANNNINNDDIAKKATENLINHKIKNANHDLLANVVAALIFEPNANKSKLEQWGKLVNATNELTSQGNELWNYGKGTGTWRENVIFKPVTTKFQQLVDATKNINDILADWGVNSEQEEKLFGLLKIRWKNKMINFIKNDPSYTDKITIGTLIKKLNDQDKISIKRLVNNSNLTTEDKNMFLLYLPTVNIVQ